MNEPILERDWTRDPAAGPEASPPSADEAPPALHLDDVGIDNARGAYLLAMADDELVTGHRTLHWTGVAPSLETDLAFSTIAQDEINHADVWFQLLLRAAEETGSAPVATHERRAAVDALGLGRPPDAYRHAVACERAPGDFAETLVRQFCYDAFDAIRLAALSASSDPEVAAIARKLTHEERYHQLHADEWLERIAATDIGRERLAAAVELVWRDALWLFEPPAKEHEAVDAGLVDAPTTVLAGRWAAQVLPRLDELGCTPAEPVVGVSTDGDALPASFFDEPGGRHGVHTEVWHDEIWPELTGLYRAHPGATW